MPRSISEEIFARRRAELGRRIPVGRPPFPWMPPVSPSFPQQLPVQPPFPSGFAQPPFTPPQIPPTAFEPQFQPPLAQKPIQPKQPEPQKVTVPLWQRALQVFGAPFDWVDENIIKPGLALAGTFSGIVPEVARKPGEDFFEWKKRSWASFETPGIDINVPWSDDPWRIDVKGVLELAPWLLIPGAGQVGTATRAARGIAGVLSKFGQARRILGTAVEFSPWGLVEKTAGAAIGKVARRVGVRVAGKIPEPLPPTQTVKDLTKLMEQVKTKRAAFEKALPTELRAKQRAIIAKFREQKNAGTITAEESTKLTKQALKGLELKSEFALDVPEGLAKRVDEITETLNKAVQDDFVEFTARDAMVDMLVNGVLPEPRDIKLWAKVFGKDFADAAMRIRGVKPSKFQQMVDILNIPRAVLASYDLSNFGRQSLFLNLTHPTKVPRAFGRQIKALFSERTALDIDKNMRELPIYKKAVEKYGMEFPLVEKGAELAAKEEPFSSNIAQFIPGVRPSERAFTTYGNQIKLGAVEAVDSMMVALKSTDADYRLMGEFLMAAGGRGNLPKGLNKYAPVLNTLFFSVRFQASTLSLPRLIGRMFLSKNPYMRKEAAKALGTFAGGGAALVTFLNMTGNKVELDPRSSEFGKIRIGETRLDPWRGYVQYARFAAQILAGERKSAYGNMNKAQRGEIAGKFLQSKFSPAAGLLADLWRGENYRGEPLFTDTTGFSKIAREKFMPIAIQDIIDGMEQTGGINGAWVAAPAILGIGVVTYVNDLVRVQDKIARNAGFDSWDDIDPKQQREIENRNVELQVAQLKFDRRVMGTAWGDYRNAGNAVEDVFKDNVDKAVAQYQTTGNGFQFREKVGDAFTARRGGYAARDKEERFEDIVNRQNIEDTLESTIALGPEQLAIKTYNDALYNEEMYDEFGDYRFDEAEIRKQQLRTQLGQELFDYVEEYRGLKYELMPA
ncbi:hypothetical protein LCGC14_1575680, partial [marine sediment metagenome]